MNDMMIYGTSPPFLSGYDIYDLLIFEVICDVQCCIGIGVVEEEVLRYMLHKLYNTNGHD